MNKSVQSEVGESPCDTRRRETRTQEIEISRQCKWNIFGLIERVFTPAETLELRWRARFHYISISSIPNLYIFSPWKRTKCERAEAERIEKSIWKRRKRITFNTGWICFGNISQAAFPGWWNGSKHSHDIHKNSKTPNEGSLYVKHLDMNTNLVFLWWRSLISLLTSSKIKKNTARKKLCNFCFRNFNNSQKI